MLVVGSKDVNVLPPSENVVTGVLKVVMSVTVVTTSEGVTCGVFGELAAAACCTFVRLYEHDSTRQRRSLCVCKRRVRLT